MICTDPETIRCAKKAHRCSWCGERIEAGESYARWLCFDGGDAGQVKMHHECRDACAADPYVREDGGEFSLFDNERPMSAAAVEYASWLDVPRSGFTKVTP